jgi:hypothetical protein
MCLLLIFTSFRKISDIRYYMFMYMNRHDLIWQAIYRFLNKKESGISGSQHTKTRKKVVEYIRCMRLCATVRLFYMLYIGTLLNILPIVKKGMNLVIVNMICMYIIMFCSYFARSLFLDNIFPVPFFSWLFDILLDSTYVHTLYIKTLHHTLICNTCYSCSCCINQQQQKTLFKLRGTENTDIYQECP